MANFIGYGYQMKNGTFLAMSDTTRKCLFQRDKDNKCAADEVLLKNRGTLHRVQACLSFCHFDKPKTGEKIGQWLEDIHAIVGCKPAYISSHTVDGAANAQASVDVLEWNTRGSRPEKVVATTCDAHSINTTCSQASGWSPHKINLNPDLGAILKMNHHWCTRFCTVASHRNIMKNVQNESERVKTESIKYSVATRWETKAIETRSAVMNQKDVATALDRITAPGGAEELLRKNDDEEEKEKAGVPTPRQWEVLGQYECGMDPMLVYVRRAQSTDSIAHEEMFYGRQCIEELSACFFPMFENLSELPGSRGGADLTVSFLCLCSYLFSFMLT